VLAPPGDDTDPAALARFIRDAGITHLKLVPSLLRMLLAVPEFGECPALQHVFCGGEELTPDLVEGFERRATARLHNLYGPTETCVDVSAHACRPGERSRVPIGLPIDNTELLVLDASGARLPAGIPGELAVAGIGLARGYLGRDELTRERFVPRPGNPAERIYRTGDRVRERLDGELEFLGRLDHQRSGSIPESGGRSSCPAETSIVHRSSPMSSREARRLRLRGISGSTSRRVCPERSSRTRSSFSTRFRSPPRARSTETPCPFPAGLCRERPNRCPPRLPRNGCSPGSGRKCSASKRWG
jgi:acyl-CoA synthetase (AMP-forming)/AMP-acid ligase II